MCNIGERNTRRTFTADGRVSAPTCCRVAAERLKCDQSWLRCGASVNWLLRFKDLVQTKVKYLKDVCIVVTYCNDNFKYIELNVIKINFTYFLLFNEGIRKLTITHMARVFLSDTAAPNDKRACVNWQEKEWLGRKMDSDSVMQFTDLQVANEKTVNITSKKQQPPNRKLFSTYRTGR